MADKKRHTNFYTNFVAADIYSKIRESAIASSLMNLVHNEFLFHLVGADVNDKNEHQVQKYLNILFLKINFSSSETETFRKLLDDAGLNSYTLPDDTFLANNSYNTKKNTVDEKPAASWTEDSTNGGWNSPIGDAPALTDAQSAAGSYYIWDEDAYQADNTKGWVLKEL